MKNESAMSANKDKPGTNLLWFRLCDLGACRSMQNYAIILASETP